MPTPSCSPIVLSPVASTPTDALPASQGHIPRSRALLGHPLHRSHLGRKSLRAGFLCKITVQIPSRIQKQEENPKPWPFRRLEAAVFWVWLFQEGA